MKVIIELMCGPNHNYLVTKEQIQKNIDALDRAIKNNKIIKDDVLLMDTKSILKGIQEKLPN